MGLGKPFLICGTRTNQIWHFTAILIKMHFLRSVMSKLQDDSLVSELRQNAGIITGVRA